MNKLEKLENILKELKFNDNVIIKKISFKDLHQIELISKFLLAKENEKFLSEAAAEIHEDYLMHLKKIFDKNILINYDNNISFERIQRKLKIFTLFLDKSLIKKYKNL